MAKITLYLTVAKESIWNGVRSGWERKVNWPGVPNEGEIVFIGESDDGEECGLNARVNRRSWSVANVTVELILDYCRDEYDDIKEDVARDGFKLLHDFK